MTSLNVVLESLKVGYHDRIPVVPLVGIHSAKLAEISVSDALRDAEKMAKAELFALNRYGYDGIFPFMDQTVEAEAMGCEIYEREGEIPAVAKSIVKEPEDIEKLEVPDPQRDGRFPVFLRAVEEISEKVGGDVAVCAYITGPFTLASHLMGIEQVFINCIRSPEVLDELLKVTTSVSMRYGKDIVDMGAHVVMILEPVAALISPTHFKQFVTSYISKMADNIRRNNAFSILHICGNTSALLEGMAKTGVDGVNINASVDIGFAEGKVGDKVCIMGNIDPIKAMLDGSPENVKKASEECIGKAGERRFILSSGCEIPKDTPPENVDAMVKVVR